MAGPEAIYVRVYTTRAEQAGRAAAYLLVGGGFFVKALASGFWTALLVGAFWPAWMGFRVAGMLGAGR